MSNEKNMIKYILQYSQLAMVVKNCHNVQVALSGTVRVILPAEIEKKADA
jgi:hypothetical protein